MYVKCNLQRTVFICWQSHGEYKNSKQFAYNIIAVFLNEYIINKQHTIHH